jgi:predicted membrane GTPase involved in stress response
MSAARPWRRQPTSPRPRRCRANEYIASDKLLEVTPKSLSRRKRILNNNERQKARKSGK